MPVISICIVSYNCQDLLEKCLESIRKNVNLPYEVIVVDNGSNENSNLTRRFGGQNLKLILNPQNLGFTKANNQALRAVSAPFILLLNPDTEILPESLEKLVNFLEKHKDAAAVVPKLVDDKGNLDRNIFGQRNLLVEILESTIFGRPFLNCRYLQQFRYLDRDWSKIQPADSAGNACFLIKKSVLDKIGLLDERFTLYFSDDDLCRRIRAAGFNIYYFPKAKIIHKVRQIIGKADQKEIYKIYKKDMLAYHRKYSGLFGIGFFLVLLKFDELLFFLAEKMQSFLPRKAISPFLL